ncbi:MAG: Spy/CpxP family protein refolding chaperone [Hyphomicrobiaceae bacterium]|nr:MAG: Spy/CpxP family protein refolding chaperone [Hyphomicrobiaceae bacterium]
MKKKTVVISAIAAATVLAGGWAMAQSAGPGSFGPPFMHGKGADGMGHGMMRGMGHGMMKGMGHGMGPGMMHGGAGLTFADPARIDALKAGLAITPAQEAAWSKYAKAVQDAAATMKTTRESIDPTQMSKMTPSDRFAFMTKMREQRQTQFDAVKKAAEELLATLDAAQKAKATDILPGLAFGPGPMRGASAGDQQHRH